MQKSIQGAAGDSDKLAIALGLSGKQLRDIVEHAKTSHDLLGEILLVAPGIANRLGEVNDKQLTLIETLDLYKARWEGLIAGPLFARFTEVLKTVLLYLDKHQDVLTEIGVSLGKMVDLAGQFAEHFIASNWSGITGVFKDLLKLAAGIANFFAFAASSAVLVHSAASDESARGDRRASKSTADSKQDVEALSIQSDYNQRLITEEEYWKRREALKVKYAAIYDQIDQAHPVQGDAWKSFANNVKTGNEALLKADAIIDGLGKKKVPAVLLAGNDLQAAAANPTADDVAAQYKPAEAYNTALRDINTKNIKPKYDNSALRADEEELRAEIEKTKAAYQDEFASVQDAVTRNVLNRKEAAAQIKGLYQQEIIEINETVDAQEKKARASGANPELIKAGISKMEQERVRLTTEARKGVQVAERAADAEDEQYLKAHYAALMQMQVEYAKERLATLRQGLAEGYVTQTQVFDAETRVYGEEYAQRSDIARNEIARTAAGTAERVKAVQALTLLDAQYTAQTVLRAQERIFVAQQEAQVRFQSEQKTLALTAARLELVKGGSDITGAQARYDLDRQILALNVKITDQAIANTAALLNEARAKNENSKASQDLATQLLALQNDRLKQFNDGVAKAGTSQGNNPALARQAQEAFANDSITKIKTQADLLVAAIRDTSDKIKAAADNSDEDGVSSGNVTRDGQQAQLDATNKSLKTMQTVADTLGLSWDKAAKSLEQSLLGPSFEAQMTSSIAAWKAADGAMRSLSAGASIAATGLSGLTNIASAITGSIKQYESGRKNGGVIGGIGSLLSSGPLSDAASMIPIVGSLVKPLGAAFEFIGGMFVAQAKKIADSITKAVSAIEKTYSQGGATLAATISALQVQRDQAIAKLSGVKGGQDQLNNILPAIDDEIAQLKKQATDLQKTFTDQLKVLQAGGTELQNWTKTWMDINKQVQDFLDSGGDIATANAFLSATLANQQKTIADSLVSGDQQAIADALSLNDLIQQRIDLIKAEAAAEFGIVTKDAIEKRTATAVQTASALQTQKDGYNKQIDDLNNQISLASQKVALESQVFDIASSKPALEAQSNALTLYSLKEQLDTYKQMQAILQSTAGLTFSGSTYDSTVIPGAAAAAAAVAASPITLSVTVNAGNQDVNGTAFASQLAAQITAKIQSGRTTY